MILIEEKDKRFYIDKSSIQDAGKGLFAAEDISKDSYLEIIGIMVNVNSVCDMCTEYANNYKFAANFANKYDRHIIPIGYGALVNHTDNKDIQNVEIRYLKTNLSNEASGSAVYYFIKDVKKGEEILGNYGEEWKGKIEEENHWQMLIDLDLYNLKQLKGINYA